jgi:hypothetical protein
MPLQRSVSIFLAYSIAALYVLLAHAPNLQASQSTAAITQNPSPATPMIPQEGDGSTGCVALVARPVQNQLLNSSSGSTR